MGIAARNHTDLRAPRANTDNLSSSCSGMEQDVICDHVADGRSSQA